MKVFLNCTTKEFQKYKNQYLGIRNFIVEEGHILTRDWLQNIHLNTKEYEDRKNGSKRIYELTLNALNKAQVLIVEATVDSFSNGHLITIALQKRIPALVLWQSQKKKYFSKSFIEGIEDNLLEIEQYTGDGYKNLIRSFLSRFSDKYIRHHFHLVLTDQEKQYIEWLNTNGEENRSEAIRNAVRTRMKGDRKYQRYLTQ